VFNIKNIENKEKAKYSTKKIITEGTEFFLETKNQIRARTISARNLIPRAARICKVWLSLSLLLPLT
jgi:hypothetical protein